VAQTSTVVSFYGSGINDGDFISFTNTSSCTNVHVNRLVIASGNITIPASGLGSLVAGLYSICYSTSRASNDSDYVNMKYPSIEI
jgi:hypothetical protein